MLPEPLYKENDFRINLKILGTDAKNAVQLSRFGMIGTLFQTRQFPFQISQTAFYSSHYFVFYVI